MSLSSHNSVRGALIGLLLLLAAATSLFGVDVDNDGDAATPAVNVQLQLAAPSERHVVSVAVRAPSALPVKRDAKAGLPARDTAVNDRRMESEPRKLFFPLVVPLRT
jgi:hypothetical protein